MSTTAGALLFLLGLGIGYVAGLLAGFMGRMFSLMREDDEELEVSRLERRPRLVRFAGDEPFDQDADVVPLRKVDDED